MIRLRVNTYSLESLQKRIKLINNVIEDWKAGLTYQTIAKKNHINVATAFNIIKENNGGNNND